MILIIDGYNILKYEREKLHLSQAEREKFIDRLKQYATLKKISIIVVFDGGPLGWRDKETYDFVQVVYTGKDETADAYIIDYCERSRGKNIVVVSSDREIARASARLGIETLNAQEFYRFLGEAFSKMYKKQESHNGRTIKSERVISEPEVDSLMEYGSSLQISKKDEFSEKKRNRLAGNDSKKEKRRFQKLKKL